MVVIAILSVVAALLVVAAGGARRKLDTEAAKTGVQFISSKLDAYKNKRGQLPPNLNEGTGANQDEVTTEKEIYYTLKQWGFDVPVEKQIDPWGRPYVIVLSRDYGKSFDLIAPYDRNDTDPDTDPEPRGPDYAKPDPAADPRCREYLSYLHVAVSDMGRMYHLPGDPNASPAIPEIPPADGPKEIHVADDATAVHNDAPDGYQVTCAGPDGKIYCDDDPAEPNRVYYRNFNADNITNW